MSEVECRAGTIKRLGWPEDIKSLDAIVHLVSKYVGFEPQEFVKTMGHVYFRWVSEDEKKEVVYIKGNFYLVEYTHNNTDLHLELFHHVNRLETVFAVTFYNGGTFFENILERNL